MKHRTALALVALLALARVAGACSAVPDGAAGAQAQPGADPARLALATERVVVFKDGYALFVKRATAVADALGCVHTDEVPESAVLGSFWVSSADGRAPAVRAEWVETKEERTSERPCLTMAELLRASVGRTLSLELLPEGARITGKVVEVLEQRSPVPLQPDPYSPYSPHSSFSSFSPYAARSFHAQAPVEALSERTTPLPFTGGQFVVLDETPSGRVVLQVARILGLSGEVGTRTTDLTLVESKHKRLVFELGASSAGERVDLHLYYFRPGMRWIPTYRLREIDPGPARLSMQAEILNEAEDVEGALLDLVVGFPNFRFKEVVSPLVLEAALRNALQEAAPSLMSQSLSNAQFTARAGESLQASEGGAPEVPAEIAGSGEQDLFVRTLGAFSLRKGARAALPLDEERVERRHLYTLDLALKRDSRTGPEGTSFDGPIPGSPLRRLPHQVWHQLELTNPGRAPWTTGALLMMQQHLPVAQELLPYTSRGATALVPMTVAVDVRAEQFEVELERQPNALVWGNSSYSLVKKRGELTLTNHRQEAISLRVTLGTGGRASEASDGGAITIDDFRADDWGDDSRARVNNHSDIRWQLELGPGESRALSYLVQLYVY